MRLETHDQIASIAPEWNELADRVNAAPWLRPEWFEAWHRAFSPSSSLELFVVRGEGRLSGVLPMLRRHRGLAAPANWHTPDFCPLAEDVGVLAELVDGVLAARPRSFTLAWLPSEALEPVRSAARRRRYLQVERTLMQSPYLPLNSDSSTPRASTVRRHRRKLEREGELRVDVEPGTEHLEDGFRLEASGWKGENGTAILSSSQTHTFYAEFARRAAERGILRLFFLRLDERPIAFVLGLEDNGRLYYVKGGFDVEFRAFGPGVIITHEMIGHAREQGLSTFEFLGGEDRWKLEWTTKLRERRLFQAFARDPVGLAQWSLYAHARPAAKLLLSKARNSVLDRG